MAFFNLIIWGENDQIKLVHIYSCKYRLFTDLSIMITIYNKWTLTPRYTTQGDIVKAEEFVARYYTERKGTNSLKWDALDVRFGDPDLLSMWVADMEFKTPECVVEALEKRVQHGVFGYSLVPNSYYEAIIQWELEHHHYELQKEWIRITPGVVAALYWAINIFTNPGDAVIIQTPVYYPFHHGVRDSHRKLVTCELDYDRGIFTFNPERFEEAIIDNAVKLYIMCSPHNPAGRVWTRKELETMLEICKKHHVLVISDEIHQDLTFSDHPHIPAGIINKERYNDTLITCFASSKTFNLATCLTSTVVIENEELRKKWDAFTKVYHNVDVNIFGITAVEAALCGGEEWYAGLKEVIQSNYELVVEGLQEFSDLYVSPLEGTYLVLLDLRNYVPLEEIRDFMQKKCKLAVDYGEWFGKSWKGFIRLNLATHPDFIREAISNIVMNLRGLVNQ